MQKKIIFLDGLMIPVSESFAQALSPGILNGKGVFETMRSYRGEIYALEEHMARLIAGLKSLGMELPLTERKLREYLYASLDSNRLSDARVRLTVWRSQNRARISIMSLPYREMSSAQYTLGFKAVISDIRRDETSRLSRIKSINYLPLTIARRRARNKGADEAILLNREGYVAEGTRSNIFYIKNGVLYTPSITCGCLKGITRQVVFKIAQTMNRECHETRVLPQDLMNADEAFLTNSLLEVMPLTRVDGKVISCGKIGPLTARILNTYKQWSKDNIC